MYLKAEFIIHKSLNLFPIIYFPLEPLNLLDSRLLLLMTGNLESSLLLTVDEHCPGSLLGCPREATVHGLRVWILLVLHSGILTNIGRLLLIAKG